MSASGLFGSRMDVRRAGIRTVKLMQFGYRPSSESLKVRASASSITGNPSRIG